jgi:selenocysteine lyase/cysteine desulfurase
MEPVKAYFNYAGLGRPADAVLDRVHAAEREYAGHLFSEDGVAMYLAALAECRAAVGAILGLGDGRGISLMANATTAVQMVLSALGAPLQPRDVVVTSDQEHPCVVRPLNLLAQRGIEIAALAADSPAGILERLDGILRRRHPAFVIMSHVSYKNGHILPVNEIGAMLAPQGIPFIIDGAQAFAHIPVNPAAAAAWAYIFSGHKWLGGPWGTGGLWTNEAFAARNRFMLSNWEHDSDAPDGGRYEGGTMNYASIAGFIEACHLHRAKAKHRFDLLTRKRAEINLRLEGIFASAAAQWNGANAPGILAWLMPPGIESARFAAQILKRHRVAVKPFRPPEFPDAIRVSFSTATTVEEIELLAVAMREAGENWP